MAGVVLGTSVLQGLVRAPHARGYTSQRWTGTGDRVDDALLGAMGVVMLAAPLVHASGRPARFDYPLTDRGRRALAAAGVALNIASVWLFHGTHADLDRNWSPHVELRDEQDLVTDGVYRHVRHPMYASQFLLGAGQACLLQDWVSGPSNLLSFWPLYLRRSPREDAAMRARFGAAWEAWAARTGGVLSRP